MTNFSTRNRFVACLIILLFSLTIHAQSEFIPGYLILKDGTRKTTLLRNNNPRYNPETIATKSDPDAKTVSIPVSELREYGAADQFKYLIREVDMESSGNNEVLSSPALKYAKKLVPLRVEASGNLSLLAYYAPNQTKFFVQNTEGNTLQLTSFRYQTNEGEVARSAQYIATLNNYNTCPDYAVSDRLKFRSEQLIDVIKQLNECRGSTTKVYRQNQRKGKLQLGLQLGAANVSAPVERARFTAESINFGSGVSPRVGFSLIYTLPSNSERLALLFSPTVYFYDQTADFAIVGREIIGAVKFTAVDLPLGLRVNFGVPGKLRPFAEALIGYTYLISEDGITYDGESTLEVSSPFSVSAGAGVTVNNNLTLSLRYGTTSDLLPEGGFSSRISTVSLLAGYHF